MSYLKRHAPRRVPQWAPIPGAAQVPNSAGGFAFEVDDWTRLRRFLILGSEGGSYYASEWTLTRENAQAVERCIRADAVRSVAEITQVSEGGPGAEERPGAVRPGDGSRTGR
jgi:60 kDa SS-A/Ro ribonucleoprotein